MFITFFYVRNLIQWENKFFFNKKSRTALQMFYLPVA